MAKPNVAKPTTRKSKDAGKSKGKANAATTIDPAVLLFVQVVNDLTFKNGANAPGHTAPQSHLLGRSGLLKGLER